MSWIRPWVRPLAIDEPAAKSDALAIAEYVIDDNHGGVEGFLRRIAEQFNAFGAAMFELTGPPVENESQLKEISANHHRLFVMAAWFDAYEEAFALDHLSVEKTTTGEVLKSGQPKVNLDLPRTWPPYAKNSFFLRHHVSQVMVVRIKSKRDECEGKYRTLNLYRSQDQPRFTEKDLNRLVNCAGLIDPILCRLEERLNLQVMLEIDEALLVSHAVLKGDDPLEPSKHRIRQCCQRLKKELGCCEVSAFVSDTANATEFPMVYSDLPDVKPAIPGSGLTGWVLQNRQPMHVLDLRHFPTDRPWINDKYPGAVWTDSGKVKPFARKELSITADDPLPPLSFMAAPILAEGNLYGVLRCSVRKSSPSYFSRSDLILLVSVATRIGVVCRDAQKSRTEHSIWESLAGEIATLNAELPSSSAQRDQHLQAFLSRVHAILPQADMVDVRLVDSDEKNLKAVAQAGPAWDGLASDVQKKFIDARYPLERVSPPNSQRPYASLGAQVYATQTPVHTLSPQTDPCYARLRLVDTRELAIVPVTYGDTCYGVLDLHRMGDEPFPDPVLNVGQLLGSQLGLHLNILDAFDEKQQQQNKIKAASDKLNRAHQDLGHQLKTPLRQLARRIERAIRDIKRTGSLRDGALYPIRGLAGKASSVAQTMRLLADLHREVPIQPKREAMNTNQIQALMVELAADAELLVDPERHIKFSVDRESVEWSFYRLPRPFRVDRELLKQCITNLLDNAGKYSYPDTMVRISISSVDSSLRFHVKNTGIPLTEDQVQQAPLRDWRSHEAIRTTGEGSGIGLWIVDQIMRAHNGGLVPTPTDDQGDTLFTLEFPV